ncbi:MAG: malate/lactate/ureidoglycolate dehydrogenase [Paracoccaceae bacterium]|nr:malate/lactate/ureidoglycolate dehydrogenase [Paracoccaceae bacterium]
MRVPSERLEQVASMILGAMGSPDEEAALVAGSLVGANLMGHDSHGIGLLPVYVGHFRDGMLKPGTAVDTVRDDGPILQFDGRTGFGRRVGGEAMNIAVSRCREHGVSLMTLKNAHHLGRIGAYGEIALASELVSIHFVNVIDHAPKVAPWEGSTARFVTNPVCIAVPGTGNTPPILLDMATSRIALGKARVAALRGQPVEMGNVVDADGRPSNDPGVVFADPPGALLPFGEYKGSGLALICELLAGGLSGGGTIQPENPRRGSIMNNMTTILIDPARFADRTWLADEIDAMVGYVKSSPPAKTGRAVQVAGDPERAVLAERQKRGIPIDPAEWREIADAGIGLGLEPSAFERVSGRTGSVTP